MLSRFRSPRFWALAALALLGVGLLMLRKRATPAHHVVAVANYGPQSTLEISILGFKEELTRQGFVEGKQVRYEIANVGFVPSLIPQMLMQLKSTNPDVMLVMTTPVAQTAKAQIHPLPLVFHVVTDPVAAGLLSDPNTPTDTLTGVSDRQDLTLLLELAKQLLPHATRVGLLYATGEANDAALVQMLQTAAAPIGMTVVALAIDQARDIPLRMRGFAGKVDLLYVGTSGPILPSLPAIVAEADTLRIPVFSADSTAVQTHQVLGSVGVDYTRMGMHAGQLVARILRGEPVRTLPPVYPTHADHHACVSRRKAAFLQISLPPLPSVTFVD